MGPRVQCAKPNGAWANFNVLSERNLGNETLLPSWICLLNLKHEENKILSKVTPQTGVLLCRHKEPAVPAVPAKAACRAVNNSNARVC